MPMTPNTAKDRLAAGDLAIGFGLRSMRTTEAARIARTCGYDWLFIDMEHGSFDVDLVCQLSVAALDTGVTPIVRVPGHQHFHAARVLDGGAMGVVVPHVSTVAQARAVVEHCKFPPIGHRSITGLLPQVGFENPGVGELTRQVNDATLVVIMLETPEAIENVDAIAAVDGVDVLLIGTNDLCAEMGIHGDFGNDRVADAYRKTIAAARAHGKYAGMGGVYDMEIAARYIGMGAQFLLGGNDTSFIIGAAKGRSEALRSISR